MTLIKHNISLEEKPLTLDEVSSDGNFCISLHPDSYGKILFLTEIVETFYLEDGMPVEGDYSNHPVKLFPKKSKFTIEV